MILAAVMTRDTLGRWRERIGRVNRDAVLGHPPASLQVLAVVYRPLPGTEAVGGHVLAEVLLGPPDGEGLGRPRVTFGDIMYDDYETLEA